MHYDHNLRPDFLQKQSADSLTNYGFLGTLYGRWRDEKSDSQDPPHDMA